MSKKQIFFILLFSFIAFLNAYTVKHLQETPNFVELEISLNTLSITESDVYTQIHLLNAYRSNDFDSPDIPEIRLLFAVPRNGSLQASVQGSNFKVVNLRSNIIPVGRPNQEDPFYSDYHVDLQKYSRASRNFVARVEPKEAYGRYDLVPVVLNPITYNPSQNNLTYPETIILTINISGEFPSDISEYAYRHQNVYSDIITNSTFGLNFIQERNTDFYTSNFDRSHSWYKIEVLQTGMQELDFNFLNSALPLDAIDPRTIRIFSTGGSMLSPSRDIYGIPFEEIPIHVVTASPSSFSQQDRIYFFGEDRDNFGKNLPHARYWMNNTYDGRDERTTYALNIGDYILANPFSKAGVYWLTWGGNFEDSPKRITALAIDDASITRTSGRVNTLHYNPSVKKEQYGFNWFSQEMLSSTASKSEYKFNVVIQDIDTSLPQRFDFVGSANRNARNVMHSLDIRMNNSLGSVPIYSREWLLHDTYREDRTEQMLREGNNELIFSIGTNGISQFLMWYNIEWYRNLIKRNTVFVFKPNPNDIQSNIRYQITNPNNQQNLRVYQINSFKEAYLLPINNNSFIANANSNTQFHLIAPNDYLRPNSISRVQTTSLDNAYPEHDVAIFFPEEFRSGAVRLQSIYEREYDYKVHIASIEHIFENFNGGHPDPMAIRNYLHFLLNTAEGTPPLGAVFLGSGTIDNRDFSGAASSKNRFLVNQLEIRAGNEYTYITTTDDYYAIMEGKNLNRTPETIVGRIPAKTLQELNIYLDKLEEYLRNPTPGWWQYTFQMVADDEIYQLSPTDYAHSYQSERIARNIDDNIIVDKLYALEYELDPFKRKPQVRDILVDRINEGRLYWLFIGHGSIRNNGDERYFTADTDVHMLRNKGRYPIYMAASCNCGQYEMPGILSVAEELVLLRDAGSIASIGATGKSGSGANSLLFNSFADFSVNSRQSPGLAMMNAKIRNNPQQRNSNLYYNILGDPFLHVAYPTITNDLEFKPDADSLLIWQTVQLTGNFNENLNSNIANSLVFDSGRSYNLTTLAGVEVVDEFGEKVVVARDNLPIFRGSSTLTNGSYNLGFVIPDEISPGARGKIYSMAIDNNNRTYVNVRNNIRFSNEKMSDISTDPPNIELFLDNYDFQMGDSVSPSPKLFARISSQYGLNTVGARGRNMWIVFDNTNEIVEATSGFEYDLDSYTHGTLTWQFNNLKAGRHDISLSVYDTFNTISVAKTWFLATEEAKVEIENLLVYPNPIRDYGYFTFELMHEATVTINIYTITGRRIQTITADHRPTALNNFAEIPWNGRDADGDRIANGTYIYTVRVNLVGGRGSQEVTDKLMILR